LVDWIASDTFPTKIIKLSMEVSMEKAVVAADMIWLEDFAFEVPACGDILDDSMVPTVSGYFWSRNVIGSSKSSNQGPQLKSAGVEKKPARNLPNSKLPACE
jgi:hypothetical protein